MVHHTCDNSAENDFLTLYFCIPLQISEHFLLKTKTYLPRGKKNNLVLLLKYVYFSYPTS